MDLDYYQERDTGDYLSVEAFCLPLSFAEGRMDARAAAIANSVSSVQGCSVSSGYLARNCRPVAKMDVPAAWLAALAWE